MSIAVVGIGNILLCDEGAGVRVIEALRNRYCFPEDVNIIDGGTGGMDLVPVLAGCGRLMVIDAVAGGEAPGSIYLFRHAQVRQYLRAKASLHEIGMQEVLKLLEMLGKRPQEIVFIGIEPAVVEFGFELSPLVKARLDRAVAMVVRQLADWGIEALDKQMPEKAAVNFSGGCSPEAFQQSID